MNGFGQHLSIADEVIGAGISPQQGKVAPATGSGQGAVILGAANGDSARAFAPWVLPFGMEEVLLRILVGAERDQVEGLGLGDFLNALDRRFHRRQAKVVAQNRVRRLPADARSGRLGVVCLAGGLGGESFQVSKHLFGFFAPVKDFLEKTDFFRPFGHWRCSRKGKTHACFVQVTGGFGKLAEQALAGFRGQAVRNANQIRFFFAGSFEQGFHRNCGAKKDGFPACFFSQAQEV